MFKKIYHTIETTHNLNNSGKLHKKITLQLYMMLGMILVGLGIIIYDIIVGRISPLIAFITIVVTTLIGYFMARMNKIVWDEEQELLVAGKMDWTNGIILAVYMSLRLGSKYFLNNIYHNTATVFAISMAILAGIALGRFLGISFTVRKTYLKRSSPLLL